MLFLGEGRVDFWGCGLIFSDADADRGKPRLQGGRIGDNFFCFLCHIRVWFCVYLLGNGRIGGDV